MKFKSVDRIPNMELGAWGQTVERWIGEGMPEWADPGTLFFGNSYFGIEGIRSVDINGVDPYPPFEYKVLEENNRMVLFIDERGRTRKAMKTGTVRGTRLSMDQYVDFYVKDRKTYLEMVSRYKPDWETRYPKEWEKEKDMAEKTDMPLTLMNPMIGTFGFYSMLRNWMGTEGVSYMFYDDPCLITECLEFLTGFIVSLLNKAVMEIKFDFYIIHEDMCYKNGPLVGPELFRSMFLPFYKRYIDFLKSNGVKAVIVDTDGNFEKLIPVFLEAGVDGFTPMEVAAGMDPVRIRKKYGRAFSMNGGIDKRELSKDKKEIEQQVYNVILPLIEQGGYIPTVDHTVPPEVSLENFMYYLELKSRALRGEL